MNRLVPALIALFLCHAGAANAAGFEFAQATNTPGPPLDLAIWYPSTAAPADEKIGPFQQRVARGGPVTGELLPLIVISHGTGGTSLGHYDSAIALADAGFVVVAVTHPGDNARDHALSFKSENFSGRARHISLTVDFMLTGWRDHGRVDPARIGVFGHSAGGATALLVLGAELDWGIMKRFCLEHPDDWGCQRARQNNVIDTGASVVRGRDGRVKAAVLGAPALGAVFTPEFLAAVKSPVQVWIAGQDVIARDAILIGPRLPPHEDHLEAQAGHYAFLAPCGADLAALAPEICEDPAGFDRRRFLAGFHRSMIAFFQANLR